MSSEGFPFIVGVWGWTCVRVVLVVSSCGRRCVLNFSKMVLCLGCPWRVRGPVGPWTARAGVRRLGACVGTVSEECSGMNEHGHSLAKLMMSQYSSIRWHTDQPHLKLCECQEFWKRMVGTGKFWNFRFWSMLESSLLWRLPNPLFPKPLCIHYVSMMIYPLWWCRGNYAMNEHVRKCLCSVVTGLDSKPFLSKWGKKPVRWHVQACSGSAEPEPCLWWLRRVFAAQRMFPCQRFVSWRLASGETSRQEMP